MSTELLKEVQELNLQAYAHTGLQLKHVAPIHLTVGPMDLVHPVYVSTRIHSSLGKICLIALNL